MAGDRLKVLYVTHVPPSPARYGAQVRMHGLMTALARRHDVSAISIVDPADDAVAVRRAMEAYCEEVILVPGARAASDGAKRMRQLRSLVSRRSFERRIFSLPALAEALAEVLGRRRFHLINAESPFFAHLALEGARRRSPGPPVVLDEHNVEWDLVRQMAGSGAGIARRVYNAADWRKLRREEEDAWARVDGVTLTSAVDERRVRRSRPEARTAVVPNGVDVERFRPQGPEGGARDERVVFFGALDYYPNADGIGWFLEAIWPELARRRPRARLVVLGKRPTAPLLAHRGERVEIPGFVDDLRPHLARAAAVIVPLRLGGGTRLKILEAMAAGVPVVSTSIGAEGIEASPGEHLVMADDAGAFAREVERILRDPLLAHRLGAAGRTLVERRYSWEAAATRLERFFGEVLAAGAGPCGAWVAPRA